MSDDFKPSIEVDFSDALDGLMSHCDTMAKEWDGEHAKQWAQIKKLLEQSKSKYWSFQE